MKENEKKNDSFSKVNLYYIFIREMVSFLVLIDLYGESKIKKSIKSLVQKAMGLKCKRIIPDTILFSECECVFVEGSLLVPQNGEYLFLKDSDFYETLPIEIVLCQFFFEIMARFGIQIGGFDCNNLDKDFHLSFPMKKDISPFFKSKFRSYGFIPDKIEIPLEGTLQKINEMFLESESLKGGKYTKGCNGGMIFYLNDEELRGINLSFVSKKTKEVYSFVERITSPESDVFVARVINNLTSEKRVIKVFSDDYTICTKISHYEKCCPYFFEFDYSPQIGTPPQQQILNRVECLLLEELIPLSQIKEVDYSKLIEDISSFLLVLDEKKVCHFDIKPENICFDTTTKKFVLIDYDDISQVTERGRITWDRWSFTPKYCCYTNIELENYLCFSIDGERMKYCDLIEFGYSLNSFFSVSPRKRGSNEKINRFITEVTECFIHNKNRDKRELLNILK